MAKKKLPTSKTVRVSYGLLNRPNHRGIQKAIEKAAQQGYRLINRQDSDVGCLMLLFTAGLGRGRTELTFVLDSPDTA